MILMQCNYINQKGVSMLPRIFLDYQNKIV